MAISNYLWPGIYIEERPGGPRPIQAVGTSTAGFVGAAPSGNHVGESVPIGSWTEFRQQFAPPGASSTPLAQAVFGFFLNGGRRCYVVNVAQDESIAGGGAERRGLALLEEVDEVAIVAAPGAVRPGDYEALLSHCEKLKDRVAILDPAEAAKPTQLKEEATDSLPGGKPRSSDYGAFYFPWIKVQDPFSARPSTIAVPPSGHVAGIYARTDGTRGVHKAPANEIVRGAIDLTYRVTDDEQGELNPIGVNCIRFFTGEGIQVWGARTLARVGSEWRYLSVRRLFNMIEESILKSTRWVVFEPNDPALWKAIRRDVGAFLTQVWRDGALMGRTPEEAFFVQCDDETNPPEVIDSGRVVTVIGIAPVKPAEFIVFQIGQHAGGAEVQTAGGANG